MNIGTQMCATMSCNWWIFEATTWCVKCALNSNISHTKQVKILLTEDKENRANTSMKRRKCVRCTYKITSLNMWCIWIGMLWNGLDWIGKRWGEPGRVHFVHCIHCTFAAFRQIDKGVAWTYRLAHSVRCSWI